jgi:DNA-binding CsgD family transcriptional regulator
LGRLGRQVPQGYDPSHDFAGIFEALPCSGSRLSWSSLFSQ